MTQINLTILLAWLVSPLAGCEREPSAALKGQTNLTLTFYGLVVDQDGNPLPRARVEYQVDAYPKDWTFESRGRPYDSSTVWAMSDEGGRFQFTVTGCILRRLRAERVGYRHFFEESAHDGTPSTYGYRLMAWSDLWFKSDPDHPAVYVFVKDGVHEVSALPCKGGYDSVNGKHWTVNGPAWPRKPSLKDVVQKVPTSQPTTKPQRVRRQDPGDLSLT